MFRIMLNNWMKAVATPSNNISPDMQIQVKILTLGMKVLITGKSKLLLFKSNFFKTKSSRRMPLIKNK
jgi:hypothetical protein